jgi:hypothetical protein
MRTFSWIALGAMIAVGAIGIASYRHYLEPQRRTKIIQPHVGQPQIGQPMPPSSSSASAPVVRRAPGEVTRATPLSARTTVRAGWHVFETVVNVLNVVIGALGIWMTVHGMRLQRSALAATAERGR